MSFKSAITTCFSKFADFSGRARRSEYWKFMLFVMMVEALAATVFSAIIPATLSINGSEFNLVYLAVYLLFILPKLSVSIRRLHDIGKSGWAYLITLIPVIGHIVFFVWSIRDSEPRINKYGPDPKDFRMRLLLQSA